MDFQSFKKNISHNISNDLPVLLQALLYDAKGDWSKAHALVNDMPGKDAAWVHAYLHRKEGDEMNAAYWYSKAGKKICTLPLPQEWENIARELL